MSAVNGSDYVVHTASPVNFSPKHEDELVKPAVDGTRAVLEACKANKVKRLVITSSTSAVYFVADENAPGDNTYDESNWTDLNCTIGRTPYVKSKTLAEKAVWAF